MNIIHEYTRNILPKCIDMVKSLHYNEGEIISRLLKIGESMEWLKRSRENKGLTQEQIAKAVGVDRSLISKYETGNAIPSLKKAQAIAIILGFNWTRFFERDSGIN